MDRRSRATEEEPWGLRPHLLRTQLWCQTQPGGVPETHHCLQECEKAGVSEWRTKSRGLSLLNCTPLGASWGSSRTPTLAKLRGTGRCSCWLMCTRVAKNLGPQHGISSDVAGMATRAH